VRQFKLFSQVFLLCLLSFHWTA